MRHAMMLCWLVVPVLLVSHAPAGAVPSRAQNKCHGAQCRFVGEAAEPAAAERGAAAANPRAILLNTGVLDTRAAAVQETSVPVPPGNQLRLVQFAGPIKPEWHACLLAGGLRIVSYIPNNAYLVYGEAAAVTQATVPQNGGEGVAWTGAYLAEYKVQPGAQIVNVKGAVSTPATDWFTIQLVHDDAANAATLALIHKEQRAPLKRQELNAARALVNVTANLPAERLALIAAQPDVISIHPYYVPTLHCERQGQIVAGTLTGDGSQPTGPGYLAWLASNGFTQAQFTNAGFVVVVTDDGWDLGNAATPSNSEFRIANEPAQPSRVVFAEIAPGSSGIASANGIGGHGNINASIVGGYNNGAGLIANVDSSGYHYGLGIAPLVQLASTKLFADSGAWGNPNEAVMISNQYRRGARLSSNSWGANSGGAYDSDAQSYDGWVRDAEPGIAGNQEMVFIFSAGNAGATANTIGTPGTAKNVFTIGATENVNENGVADGCAESNANNANDVISFSSRGPCDDGRKKPDVVAPGTHVYGAASYAPGYDGSGVCNQYYPAGQTKYCWSSGTSHSCPAVAGAAALVRQWFINKGMTPPSPAMTKAVLMNGAQYLTGVSANDALWSNNQGMGGVQLGRTFANVGRFLRDQVSGDLFTASGQQRTFNTSIADAAVPTRVTLAWTDAPGPTTGNAYVNDLNLEVTLNGTLLYKGNNFSNAYSFTGGSADPRNNVESVFLPVGTSGSLGITITAANIAGDGVPGNGSPLDQDFALVVYNAAIGTPEVITLAATNIDATSATLTGTVNPQGAATAYYFEYGETTAYGQQTPNTGIGSNSVPLAVSAAIAGLAERTLYHARLIASNAVGFGFGGDISFGTLGTLVVPDVQVCAADNVITNAARLTGSVNPHGDATQWRFEYGATPVLGTATAVSNAGAGYAAAAMQAAVSGLDPQTTYYYRVVAWNSAGTNYSGTRALITGSMPLLREGFNLPGLPPGWITEIVSNTATPPLLSNVTASTYPTGFAPYEGARFVRFNSYNCGRGAAIRLKYTNNLAMAAGGKIDVALARTQDNGYSTSADKIEAQYSTNGTQWLTVATYMRYNLAGDAWHAETCSLPTAAALAPQLFLGFLFTSQYGNDCYFDDVNVASFSGPPLVATDIGTVDGPDSALINGLVNPNGLAAAYYFEYGQSTNYDATTTAANLAAGTSTLPVSNVLSGLSAGALYHYRIVATNSAGASRGADATVQTLPEPAAALLAIVALACRGCGMRQGRSSPHGT
jgi:hypothetical protein